MEILRTGDIFKDVVEEENEKIVMEAVDRKVYEVLGMELKLVKIEEMGNDGIRIYAQGEDNVIYSITTQSKILRLNFLVSKVVSYGQVFKIVQMESKKSKRKYYTMVRV